MSSQESTMTSTTNKLLSGPFFRNALLDQMSGRQNRPFNIIIAAFSDEVLNELVSVTRRPHIIRHIQRIYPEFVSRYPSLEMADLQPSSTRADEVGENAVLEAA